MHAESEYAFKVTVGTTKVAKVYLPFPSLTQAFNMMADDLAKLLHVLSIYVVITTNPDMGGDGEPGETDGDMVALLGTRDAAGEAELLRVLGVVDGLVTMVPSYVHFVYPRFSSSDGAMQAFRVFKYEV